jgi:hypothetical protein
MSGGLDTGYTGIEDRLITVKEFATLTNRFTNHIYILVKRGNQYRKLRSVKHCGKLMIPYSEVNEFPFTEADKLKQEIGAKVNSLEQRITKLEGKV